MFHFTRALRCISDCLPRKICDVTGIMRRYTHVRVAKGLGHPKDDQNIPAVVLDAADDDALFLRQMRYDLAGQTMNAATCDVYASVWDNVSEMPQDRVDRLKRILGFAMAKPSRSRWQRNHMCIIESVENGIGREAHVTFYLNRSVCIKVCEQGIGLDVDKTVCDMYGEIVVYDPNTMQVA